MAHVASFTFNPFQENTYVLYDDSGECVIIDPGCYDREEFFRLKDFIQEKGLRPVHLINTHCHVDHVFGNASVFEEYNLLPEIHRGELPVLQAALPVANMYGLKMDPSPEPQSFLEEGVPVKFGDTVLEVIFTPGHSPASVTLYCEKNAFAIVGDVLFQGSIGRTDLPGGDYDTLISSIKDKLLPLGDNITVYPGHGPATNFGVEARTNPFLT